MARQALLTTLVLALSTSSLAAQGSLWIVDKSNGPGANFTEVQPAVDAATEGDAILVRPGSYSGFTIDGRSLSVIGLPGAQAAEVDETVTVQSLAAHQTVLVRGFEGYGLNITGNSGDVWIEDIVPGQTGCQIPLTWPPALELCVRNFIVENSSSVTIARCEFVSWWVFVPGTLNLKSSSVWMFDCLVDFVDYSLKPQPNGQAGIFQDGGTLLLDQCQVFGGNGQAGYMDPYQPTGAGGPGVQLQGGAQLTLRNATLVGGFGGWPMEGWQEPGDPGPPLLNDSGVVTTQTGPSRPLATLCPVLQGTTASFQIEAEGGELAFLLLGLGPDPRKFPGIVGTLMPSDPLLILSLGSIPPDGALDLSLFAPNFGPLLPALDIVAQVFFIGTNGALELGHPSATVAVASF